MDATPTRALLELAGLGIAAADRILLRDVSLSVHAGMVTALCGPSGAGKSVTARACMGVIDVEPGLVSGTLRLPQRGSEDLFAGVAGAGTRAAARLAKQTEVLRGAYVSYSPQAASSALNPGRTIGRQVELAARRREARPADIGACVADLLAEVGLAPAVAAALPAELSGGMCQRAALAVAMAPAPKILVADEPETGLDPVLRKQVVELLVKVGKAHGCGILLISHHEDTVERIADVVVRLPGPVEAAA
jgi:ABC-type glutathione transport system ATPase component